MTLLAQPGTVEALLEIAASQEGYVERGGPHGNDGNITKYWADTYPPFQGASWCADFVSWCFIMAGCPLPPIDHQFGFTFCPDLANMANQKGWVIGGPRPGAIVLFREGGTWAHTEICRSVADAAGNFWTTGGNTSSGNAGSQSNGGGVYRRLRNVSGIGGGGCMFVWVPVFKSAPAPHIFHPSGGQEDSAMALVTGPSGSRADLVVVGLPDPKATPPYPAGSGPVYHAFGNSIGALLSAKEWEPLGGYAHSVSAAWTADGSTFVVSALGVDGHVWIKTWDDAHKWSPWQLQVSGNVLVSA